MQKNTFLLNDNLTQCIQKLGVSDLQFRFDHAKQLFAIIATQKSSRGPALGGCRCLPYASIEDAIYDALRLTQSMAYKAIMADVPVGGGKAVLIRPHTIPQRRD
jgi:leucine dehydrogenase